MAVGKSKIAITLNMERELKSKLQVLAESDSRSLTNYINKILTEHVELIESSKQLKSQS